MAHAHAADSGMMKEDVMKCEAKECGNKAVWVCRVVNAETFRLSAIGACDKHIGKVSTNVHGVVSTRRLRSSDDALTLLRFGDSNKIA